MAGPGEVPQRGPRLLTVADASGQRIDNFLMRELKGLPRSRVYRMLRTGEVRVNGGRVKPTRRLQNGDQVRIPPLRGGPPQAGSDQPAFIGDAVLETVARSVIFEDPDLLVLNKPAGMPVHGGSGLSFGIIEALRRLRPDATLELAHRLDRDTSGCLLIARSRRALGALHGALRAREVKKDYRLIVHGAWPRRITTVQLPLHRYLTRSGERRVRVAAEGKPSRTDFTVLEAGGQATLLAARLHTGRTHQIRVHTAASGHPVVGDSKYARPEQLAASAELGIHRLCLHAAAVSLVLDVTRLRFQAPIPEAFTVAWQALQSSD